MESAGEITKNKITIDSNCTKQGYLLIPPAVDITNISQESSWRKIWVVSNKYGLCCYPTVKIDVEPIKRFNTQDMYELHVDTNPISIGSKTTVKCFELISKSPNNKTPLRILFGVSTDKEKEEWIKYFHQAKMMTMKKVTELREKYLAERGITSPKSEKGKLENAKLLRELPKVPEKLILLNRSMELKAKVPTYDMQGFVELKRTQVSEWEKRFVVLYENGKMSFYKNQSKEEPPDMDMNLVCYCPIAEASSSSHSNCVALMQSNSMCVVSLLTEDLNQWVSAFTHQGIVQNVDMLMRNSKFFTGSFA